MGAVKAIRAAREGARLAVETFGAPVREARTDVRDDALLVEDEDDRKFHQWAYDRALKLKAIPSNPRLVFMPVVARGSGGKGGGGKDAVLKRLADLRGEGLGAVHRGLVDGDNDTEPTPPGVVRLERYALESYLADPIALYCAVVNTEGIDEDLQFASRGGVNLDELGTLRSAGPEKLQQIADLVLDRMEQSPILVDRTRRSVTLHGDAGRVPLEYRQWLFNTPKRDLRAALGRFSRAVVNAEHLNSGPKRAGLVPDDLIAAYRRLIEDPG